MAMGVDSGSGAHRFVRVGKMSTVLRDNKNHLFLFTVLLLASVILAFSGLCPADGPSEDSNGPLIPMFGDGTVSYAISITNGTCDKGSSGVTEAGTTFLASFTANAGYYLPSSVSVSIGGAPASPGIDYSYDSSTGNLQINGSAVTGDIEITVVPVAYDITVTITLVDGVSGVHYLKSGEDLSIILQPNKHYDHPQDVDVTINSVGYVGYTYDSDEGLLFISGADIDGDVTVFGECLLKSYTITYSLGGGTSGSSAPESSLFGDEFMVSAPTRDGFEFAGWRATSGLDTECAYWGTTTADIRLVSSNQICFNGATGDVYFLDLAVGDSVTLTAVWIQKIPLPIHNTTPIVYNKSEQTYYPSNYDADHMVITGNTATVCGTYTSVSITLAAGCVWVDGTTGAKSDYFEITPKMVTKPTDSLQYHEYNGNYQQYTPLGYDSEWMVMENNIQRNAGFYTVRVNLADSVNSKWSTNTTETLSFTFYITKLGLTKPTEDTTSYVYDGNPKYYVPVGYTLIQAHASIDGYIRTNAGTQTVTVSIDEPSNCYWGYNEGDVAPVLFQFKVTKADIAVPTVSSKVYNCANQTADISDTETFTVESNPGGTDVGTYYVSVCLRDVYFENYRWAGHEESEQTISVEFHITKATITGVTTTFNPDYTGSEQKPPLDSLVYSGVSITFATAPEDAAVTLNLKTGDAGIIAGQHTMNIDVVDAQNYLDYHGSFEFTINKYRLTEPTEDPNKDDFVYTGSPLTYNPQNITAQMDVTNNIRTNAGTQKVSVDINDTVNFMWADGSQKTVQFDFTVKKNTKDVPVIASKSYNCSLQTATLDSESYYNIIENLGGENVGGYPVILGLKDDVFSNYRWAGYTEDIQVIELTFNIVKAEITGVITAFTCSYDKNPHLPALSDLVFTGFSKGPTSVTISLHSGYNGKDAGSHMADVAVSEDTNFQDYSGTVTYVITKAILSIPTDNTDTFIYNGSPQIYYPIGFVSDTMNIANNVQTTAGNYTVTVSIKDEANYEWTGGGAEIKSFIFEIVKKSIEVPEASSETYTYNGSSQTYTPIGYDSVTMSITGNVRTDAGEQTVTVSITDIVNYQWQGGGQNDVEFQFRIWKASLDVPSAGSSVFNCMMQKSSLQDTEYYTVESNDGGLAAGSYPVELKIIDAVFVNYRWSTSDESTQTITIYFEILKATISSTTTIFAETYSGEVQTPVKSDIIYTGFSIRPRDESVMLILAEGDEGIIAGSHTMVVKVTDDVNYLDYDGTVEYTILRVGLNKPSADMTTHTYNGQEQTYKPENMSEFVVLSNYQRTDAGSQTVSVDIIDLVNYEWNGGGQETVDFTFTINRTYYDMSAVQLNSETKVYNGKPQTLEITGTLPTGLDGVQVTVEYHGSATYVTDGSVKVEAEFSTQSINYFTPEKKEAYITLSERTVTVHGITAVDRFYDGTTSATMVTDSAVIGNIAEGDVLTVTSVGHFVSKNCSDEQEIQIDGIIIGGDLSSNYVLSSEGNQTTAYAAIKPVSVKILGADAQNKEYDGTTDTVAGSYVPTLSWLYKDDDVTIVSGSGSFLDPNVGVGKTVKFHDYSLIGADAPNYQYSQPDDAVADITQRVITLVNGKRMISKEYDGTADGIKLIYDQHYTFDGLIKGDKVSLVDITCKFDSPDVHATKVTVSSLELDNGNYLAENNVLSARISSRLLSVSNGSVPIEKVYDGKVTGFKLTYGSQYVLNNVVNGDKVDFVDSTCKFAKKFVGPNTVTITNTALDNQNYRISYTELIAYTNPLELSLVNGDTPITKVYDGNSGFTGFTSDMYVLSGILEGDDVDLLSVAGDFDSSKVTAKRYILRSIELNNSNYILNDNELDASITPRDVTIIGLSAASKVYDGTVEAKVLGTPRLSWKYSGDDVSISNGAAEFDSPDSGKRTVSFYGYSLIGKDAENYNLYKQPASVESHIDSVLSDSSSSPMAIFIGSFLAIFCVVGALIIFRKKV